MKTDPTQKSEIILYDANGRPLPSSQKRNGRLKNWFFSIPRALRYVTGIVLLIGGIFAFIVHGHTIMGFIVPPEPQFHLGLLTTDSTGKTPQVVDMTSKCLKFKVPGKPWSEKVCVLVVPTEANGGFTANLTFDVFNDTAIDGSFKEIAFSWSSPSGVKLELGKDWQKAHPPQSGFSDTVGFHPKPDFTIARFSGQPLPVLTFKNVNVTNEQYGAMAVIVKQPIHDVGYSFAVWFKSDTNKSAYLSEPIPFGADIRTAKRPQLTK